MEQLTQSEEGNKRAGQDNQGGHGAAGERAGEWFRPARGDFESHHVEEIRSSRTTAWKVEGRDEQGREGMGKGRDRDRDRDLDTEGYG